jgi:hypothetical protein
VPLDSLMSDEERRTLGGKSDPDQHGKTF